MENSNNKANYLNQLLKSKTNCKLMAIILEILLRIYEYIPSVKDIRIQQMITFMVCVGGIWSPYKILYKANPIKPYTVELF